MFQRPSNRFNILKPREFTRLDGTVDVVFSTEEVTAESEQSETGAEPEDATEKTAPVSFHEACLSRFEKQEGKQMIRQTPSSYAAGRFLNPLRNG